MKKTHIYNLSYYCLLKLLSTGFFQEMSTLMWLFTVLMSATLKFLGGPGPSGSMKTNLLGALKELVPY